MHVMIYVLRVEVWVMQNLLDEVLELCCSSLVLSHMLLNQTFTYGEHAGIVDVQTSKEESAPAV